MWIEVHAYIVSQGLEDPKFKVCRGIGYICLDGEECSLALGNGGWRADQLNIGWVSLELRDMRLALGFVC